MRQHQECHIGMYAVEITGLIGFPDDAANKYIRKNFSPEKGGLYEIPEVMGDGKASTIFFEMKDLKTDGFCMAPVIHIAKFDPSSPLDIGMLSHEVVHATLFIMDKIGQEVDLKMHEHLCYLHQNIMCCLLKDWNEGCRYKAKKKPQRKPRKRGKKQ